MNNIARSVIISLVAVLLLALTDAGVLSGHWAEILHEVGIALLVSVVIWSVFELYRAKVSEDEWGQRIDKVTQNVFLAVLQKELPKGLIQAGQKLVFDSTLLRTDFTIDYKLLEATLTRNGTETAFVRLEAQLHYKIKNISSKPAVFQTKLALPDPIYPDMREVVRVDDFTVVKLPGRTPVEIAFEKAQVDFEERKMNSNATQIDFKAEDVQLQPGDEIEVSAHYFMAKDDEDTELLQTGLPCDGIAVTISSPCGSKQLYCRAVHPESPSIVRGTNSVTLRVGDYMLPHQGVLLWWKRTGAKP